MKMYQIKQIYLIICICHKLNVWLCLRSSPFLIHTFKSCSPLGDQPKGQKGKQLPSCLCTKYLGVLRRNLLECNLFLRIVGCPNLGYQNSQSKWISKDNWRSCNPLNYKGNCGEYMGFFHKMVDKGDNFFKVWIGLLWN